MVKEGRKKQRMYAQCTTLRETQGWPWRGLAAKSGKTEKKENSVLNREKTQLHKRTKF
jgi:hypothetical protein